MKPAARRTGLVVRDLRDEVIVYDVERHQAHCLNRIAAAVFRGADGTRCVDDLGRLLGEGLGRAEREAVVRMALDLLGQAHLLEGGSATHSRPLKDVSRRSALRQAGLGAALLLPAVASIVAPTPAEAGLTCVTNCAGQPPGTGCNCSPGGSATVCDSVCDSGVCLGC